MDAITSNYTKMDNAVFTLKTISDGAKVLYGYLAGLKDGANFSDTYIMAAMEWSQTSLTRKKKELKDAGLIHAVQIRPRLHVLYIGNTQISATRVAVQWDTIEDCNVTGGE